VPADDLAEEAFIVLREALRRAKKVGLGQLALRGREYVVSLKPCGRGMVLETLRYADEVHKSQGFFRDIPESTPDADLLDLATALIDKKTAAFHPQDYHDRYVDALRDLVERKRAAKGARVIEDKGDDKPAKGSNVVDLMAALKKSMEKPGAGPAQAASTKKSARKTPVKKDGAEADDAPVPKKTAARKRA
ncbi:MAG: Ku protein, partial [Janthinobacterium lividum]